jgi:hypothetical protein
MMQSWADTLEELRTGRDDANMRSGGGRVPQALRRKNPKDEDARWRLFHTRFGVRLDDEIAFPNMRLAP